MSFISNRLQYFDSSDFREIFRMQQMLAEPIDLSVGIPEDKTAESVKAAAIDAIKSDKTVYTPANGILSLRVAIAKKLANQNNIHCSADAITIVPGLTTGQLLIYLAILDPDDEIIVMDPYYPPYPHIAKMVGANVTYVSTLPTFLPDLPAMEASITHKTKAIVVNSPNNPTGAVYSEHTLRKIADIAERHNLLIISDEIYEKFTYEIPHFSIGSIYPNTITMNGFSKEHGMTGWRLGYICGPIEIIDAINDLQQYVVMSSSSVAQYAALEAVKNGNNIVKKYKPKRDYLKSELQKMGYSVQGMQGGFYAFIKAPHDLTDIEFIEQALNHNLIMVPGRAFSQLKGFVRISYGAPMDQLRRGVEVLKKISQKV